MSSPDWNPDPTATIHPPGAATAGSTVTLHDADGVAVAAVPAVAVAVGVVVTPGVAVTSGVAGGALGCVGADGAAVQESRSALAPNRARDRPRLVIVSS